MSNLLGSAWTPAQINANNFDGQRCLMGQKNGLSNQQTMVQGF